MDAQAAPADAGAELPQLRAQLQRRPDDAALRGAAVMAAHRAGEDAYALSLLPPQAPESWPAAVRLAAARAARNRGQYAVAAAWFDAALQRQPDLTAAAAGAAMSLAEAGDAEAANARADALLQGQAGADVLLAAAYVRQRSGRTADALDLYQRAQRLQADSAEAAAGVRAALADLGATQAALAQGPLSDAERDRLHTDRAAQAIRWALYLPENRADELAEARDALARAEANLVTLSADAVEQRRRARLDRVLALRQLERMQETVVAAEALLHEGVELPSYVQVAYADALLYLRRPRAAITQYQAALAAQPRQTDVELSLMYAQLEAEDFAAARRTVEAAIAHNPPWTRSPGAAQPLANGERARAEISLALLLSFGDDLEQAQARLEALAVEAPARADLQRELATIYLRRGWPERALRQYRLARSLDEESLALRLDLLGAERALGHYERIDAPLREIEAAVPANRHVQRQREEWDAFRGWQLDLGARRAQGDSAVFGNREQGGEFSLATPLIGDFWRVYAQAQKQDADIPEGTVAYERNGLGLRYDHAGVDLRAAWFTPQDGHSQRDAFETALRWRVSDRWWLGAQTSSASRDAPLRGRYYGITARSYALGGGWQRNERSDLSLHLARLDFSDGNQRDSAALAWREQVITQPHLKLDLHGEFAASRNSLAGGPYFNPERDRMGLLGGVLDWMSWRRYENRWNQRLGVWAGRYWQQDYGSSSVLRLNYEHEWQWGPSWSLRYGLAWFRQAYDGRSETRREVFAALHWGGLPW
ncbi:poly-beta-1,6 N-acetyl-D-glucosamine export porin PgaA [Tahibacter harae]|uniref:Poly-beta-1,6 N-acetyl-D-glucosamine export porin PgaA n=1 Tax=Tahibacter harae TaxID=2963937 RepID=A0ABT1QM64_9GAMM|nr:poly-beta-1,6 N-acetyl-D-glucosamine export porin PgaA [Tahibacter harae]MCQ4163630.1 poly-beta-1,6 N-acetyl-D-glucosamine export porin PgaA [Tahibacter harae]